MEALIKDKRIIVCVGSGGVGKTTISASLGIKAAQMGKKTLVLTIDPAKRLADALGLGGASIQRGPVPGTYQSNLHAALIQPEEIFVEFVKNMAPSKEVSEALIKNELFKQLSTKLNGSQEFTALEYLHQITDSGEYDLVILDTPPSQHAIDFLKAPEKIFSLFQKSVTKWFRKSGNSGLIQGLLHKGTQTVLKALEKITGNAFIQELSDFFENMSEMQEQVSQRSIEIHRLLTSKQTAFVLVTAFDEAKLEEARNLVIDLKRSGHHFEALVVNRFLPQWLKPGVKAPENMRARYPELASQYAELTEYYARRQLSYEQFEKHMGPDMVVSKIPDFRRVAEGVEGLEQLAGYLK